MAGHLYWGFTGNDSFFGRKDVYSSFNPLGVMHAAVPQGQSLEDLVSAFREGRSYASTGIELTDTPLSATVNGDTLTIDVSARTTVDWTAKSYIPGSSGPTTQTVNGRESASFTIDGNWKFVRVQCQDPRNTKSRAWLQPIMNLDYSG